jgi:hypothetical protein
MKRLTVILALLAAGPWVPAEETKADTSTDKLFAKCVKLLKFGPLNEYYFPSKYEAVTTLGILGEETAGQAIGRSLQ